MSPFPLEAVDAKLLAASDASDPSFGLYLRKLAGGRPEPRLLSRNETSPPCECFLRPGPKGARDVSPFCGGDSPCDSAALAFDADAWDACCASLSAPAVRKRACEEADMSASEQSETSETASKQNEAACCVIGQGNANHLRIPAVRETSLSIRLQNQAGTLVRLEMDGWLRPFDLPTTLWPAGYLLGQVMDQPALPLPLSQTLASNPNHGFLFPYVGAGGQLGRSVALLSG